MRPQNPSNIVAEFNTALVCRFAFIWEPLHTAGSGSRPEPARTRWRSPQGSLEAELDVWYPTLKKAKRRLAQTPPASDISAPNAGAEYCNRYAIRLFFSARRTDSRTSSHVQALIAKPAMEALYVRVLRRLAWLNVNRIDLPFEAPRQEVSGADLRAIITSYGHRRAATIDDLGQSSRHATTGQESIHFQRQAFARVAVDHAEDAQPSPE
jgi:hypothetical protein